MIIYPLAASTVMAFGELLVRIVIRDYTTVSYDPVVTFANGGRLKQVIPSDTVGTIYSATAMPATTQQQQPPLLISAHY